MEHWSRTIPFKVDIAGVIHIMGSALYSRPEASIRELIQNAHDAVVRRRRSDISYEGRVDVSQDANSRTLEFRDDGFGLSADEAEAYLGTVGIGMTGLLKGRHPSSTAPAKDTGLIGMFGIGLFSGFMLADRLEVESRRVDLEEGVCWRAGEGTDIELSSFERDQPGTTVRLFLKPQFARLAEDAELLERIVRDYAEFLPVPLFLNDATTRTNSIQATWFDPTPDLSAIELELESHFHETPLHVIPVSTSKPDLQGALYVSPNRTPGFAGEAVVTATILRMVISSRIQGLLPEWASFLRGVLELRDCVPTASREDLVRDPAFDRSAERLEEFLFDHFERLAREQPEQFESLLTWHRYAWAGAALSVDRLRALLRSTYRFTTSKGRLTFDEIFDRSQADPIHEPDYDRVLWYNSDRRQERWINSLFAEHDAPCVHTLRSFEESLLAVMLGDRASEGRADLRYASPASPTFGADILEVTDLEDVPSEWQQFFDGTEATIRMASFRQGQPAMAFLNESHELLQTFQDLKRQGIVPAGFQRLIDNHFDEKTIDRNEVLLNRRHRLVARALEQKTSSPLASVLRLLVIHSLRTAGAAVPPQAQANHADDLEWIADCLWGKD